MAVSVGDQVIEVDSVLSSTLVPTRDGDQVTAADFTADADRTTEADQLTDADRVGEGLRTKEGDQVSAADRVRR